MNDFDEYKKLGEPNQQKKAKNWSVAIGLQQVDGLTPSSYLIETAKKNIEGEISIDDVEKQITQYYRQNPPKTVVEQGKKEADEVSTRITKLLSNNTFSLSPAEYVAIHKFLFSGILDNKIAGKIRQYDICKDEPILNGDTVIYGRADSIKETLNYDFSQEKIFNYKGLTKPQKIERIAKFMSGIWQIHPFGEGNTRTTAVFIIKYLNMLGFKANNELFEKNSKYFRNALVRANYQNLEKDIIYTLEYLNKFFENLLLDGENILDNRSMQIIDSLSEQSESPKGSKKGDKKSSKKSDEKILAIIKDNQNITLQDMSNLLGLSVSGIRKNIDKLRKLNKIKRVGPDKGGHWELIEKE